MHDLRIKVIEIKGHCPVYKEGDEFSIVGGFMLRADKQQPLCMHSLASIMPYYVALSQGIRPAELGLGEDTAHLQCLDPCDYTAGGTVVFRIHVEERRSKGAEVLG